MYLNFWLDFVALVCLTVSDLKIVCKQTKMYLTPLLLGGLVVFLPLFVQTMDLRDQTSEDESRGKRDWTTVNGGILLEGCYEVRPSDKCSQPTTPPPVKQIGTKENPGISCKEILENNGSSPNGVYYIKTPPTVTKVYCYMKDLPGCGGGGWTTVMKIDGRKHTFKLQSPLWTNKNSYQETNGQSGVDDKETKLSTYWTLPFKSLCLGMRISRQIKWIHLNYRANSLYSVIADGSYRSFNLGRVQWKSLITGSSLQSNCNKEGFNVLNKARIGFFANQENDCNSPDSYIAFGALSGYCSGRATTGNCAASSHSDNGLKTTPAYGYILAQ